MSKQKKHKVRKMTEEDYNNYIMSLKDETPIDLYTIDVKDKNSGRKK